MYTYVYTVIEYTTIQNLRGNVNHTLEQNGRKEIDCRVKIVIIWIYNIHISDLIILLLQIYMSIYTFFVLEITGSEIVLTWNSRAKHSKVVISLSPIDFISSHVLLTCKRYIYSYPSHWTA